MQTNTSHSLLDRLKSTNSSRDWDTFVSIYRPLIQRQLHRFGIRSPDADDICQETLKQVFKTINGFNHNGRHGAFRNWLKTIVRQRLSRYMRKSRTASASGTALNEQEIAIESSLQDYWDREHDRHVINNLLKLIRKDFTETSWQSFYRVVVCAEDPKSVAQSLSLSLNSITVARSRILRRLREIGRGMIDPL